MATCVLLGDPDEVAEVAEKQGVTLPPSVEIVDPAEVAGRYVAPLVERRKAKGMTPDRAEIELQDTIMIGTMMMALDEADGLVSGAVHTTAHTIRPALQIIKTVPGCNLVSSIFFMCLPDQVLVFGDCAVNPNPTAAELADIAIQSADSAIAFGVPARVAMLSYSTGASGAGEDVEKVAEADRPLAPPRPRARRPAPVRRGRHARRRAPEGAEVGRRREGDGPHLPRPQHRERHLQGGPALGERRQHRADAPGARQAGERPLPRLPRRGHRLHDQPHRDPGPAGRPGEGRDRLDDAGPPYLFPRSERRPTDIAGT
jgi:hypothetical protein